MTNFGNLRTIMPLFTSSFSLFLTLIPGPSELRPLILAFVPYPHHSCLKPTCIFFSGKKTLLSPSQKHLPLSYTTTSASSLKTLQSVRSFHRPPHEFRILKWTFGGCRKEIEGVVGLPLRETEWVEANWESGSRESPCLDKNLKFFRNKEKDWCEEVDAVGN